MIYEVIVDISNSEVDKVFDYLGTDAEVGSRVLVPFGKKQVEGYIVGKKTESDYKKGELKSMVGILDEEPAIIPEMIELAMFLKEQYNLRMVDCLRLFIPAQMRQNRTRELIKQAAELTDLPDRIIACLRKGAEKQIALVDFLAANPQTRTDELNKEFGASALNALAKKGFIRFSNVKVFRKPYKTMEDFSRKHVLTDGQESVVKAILDSKEGSFLLHGVTGSGKTEVYMSVIDALINSGKTAIMLVPEISLTPAALKQFRRRFGETVAILHSGLSNGERLDEWHRLRDGTAQIALGARSAVFAPLQNLGVIIIDEEHDASYQSDSNPRYNTHEVAEFRKNFNKCVLVLGSATPSIETYYSALNGKFGLLNLPERINKRELPPVKIADMANEFILGNKSFFSNLLIEELERVINEGNQAIIFLNRRGYSSFVMCVKCGYVAKCKNCDVSLVYHSEEGILKCHYCNSKYKMFDVCPSCKSKYIKQGKIGTQQVVSFLLNRFPSVKILRMDYDTTQTKEAHYEILKDFGEKKAQILVGTQMVTKGHDFPNVTLVGIIDGDQSLYYSNYMSSERTFQLLTQVAGRCGRDELRGTVILQTYTPKHYALSFASQQDFIGFYRREINIREATKFPPFCKMVRILYCGIDNDKCILEINRHYNEISSIYDDGFIFLQKMRSPIQKIEGKMRYQIVMRLDNVRAGGIIKKLFEITAKHDKNVSVFVEINPQSFS